MPSPTQVCGRLLSAGGKAGGVASDRKYMTFSINSSVWPRSLRRCRKVVSCRLSSLIICRAEAMQCQAPRTLTYGTGLSCVIPRDDENAAADVQMKHLV